MINNITTILCYIVISPPLVQKNSGKNTFKDNHLSTLTFLIYRHPVTLFTGDADRHKLVTDLFYDFVSILLVRVAKFKMPSNCKISVTKYITV